MGYTLPVWPQVGAVPRRPRRPSNIRSVSGSWQAEMPDFLTVACRVVNGGCRVGNQRVEQFVIQPNREVRIRNIVKIT